MPAAPVKIEEIDHVAVHAGGRSRCRRRRRESAPAPAANSRLVAMPREQVEDEQRRDDGNRHEKPPLPAAWPARKKTPRPCCKPARGRRSRDHWHARQTRNRSIDRRSCVSWSIERPSRSQVPSHGPHGTLPTQSVALIKAIRRTSVRLAGAEQIADTAPAQRRMRRHRPRHRRASASNGRTWYRAIGVHDDRCQWRRSHRVTSRWLEVISTNLRSSPSVGSNAAVAFATGANVTSACSDEPISPRSRSASSFFCTSARTARIRVHLSISATSSPAPGRTSETSR